ncbi:MAG: hypothetical protein CSA34_07095 [Desulfobulbus propionicus]|nr:MAG: hypothetical protein CSA34_07095 [Desulfobulbus propionicus]
MRRPLTVIAPRRKGLTHCCRMVFHLVAALALFCATEASGVEQDVPAEPDSLTSATSEAYKAAKDYYYRLEREASGGKRSSWLKGVRNFRKIYLAHTQGVLAPSCLYMMARMYHRMGERFRVPLDLDEAIDYFSDVATVYPRSTLADDALFNIGDLYLESKHLPEQAAKAYLKIIEEYPEGDKYAQALQRLQLLEQKHNVPLPKTLNRTRTLKRLVNVLPVKYWSSDEYTRIVIRASGPVHYSSSLLEKSGNQPRRLYVDFAQCHIPPKYRQPVPIKDGLLKQVRTGQFNDSTVRVVLDIESISTYNIFSLNNPFRVIVDVYGEKKQKPREQDVVKTPTPPSPGTKKVEKPPVQPTSSADTSPLVVIREINKKRPGDRGHTIDPLSRQPLSLAQQLGLGVNTIVIDPGHGGKDPGASAFGLQEKNIVLKVAKRVGLVLAETYGFQVKFTRTNDIFIPLEERTAIANTEKADLFLSIHVNAHPQQQVGGVETYFLNLATNTEAMRVAALENATSTHNISEMQDILSDLMQNSKIEESSKLAHRVQDNLITGLHKANYKLKNLGVKQAPFYVLLGAQMPAILTEIGFLTNPKEAQLLSDDAFLNTLSKQIAAGIVAYVKEHSSTAMLLQ